MPGSCRTEPPSATRYRPAATRGRVYTEQRQGAPRHEARQRDDAGRATDGRRPVDGQQRLLEGVVRAGGDPAQHVAAPGRRVRLEDAGDALEVVADRLQVALRDLQGDERLHAEAGGTDVHL